MKIKSFKVIILIMIFVVAIFSFGNVNYAASNLGGGASGSSLITVSSTENTFKEQTIDEVISGADNFISSADTNGTIAQDSAQRAIDLIYNILLAIGLVVAVACGVVLGIQFMTSSAEGQAEVKEKLTVYVVGCVVIFGAFGIWKLVMVLLQNF